MAKIKSIKGRQVFDSRGNPTVEAEVFLENNISATAISPSGASTGAFEAHELRDQDKNKFLGKSVNIAVENINNKISDKLKGFESDDQKKIDKALLDLDGSENKTNLGANATLAVSLANSKCSALSNKKSLFKYLGDTFSLPIPLMNIINGGAHADNDLNIQEFMIRPDSAKNFMDAIEKCYVVIQNLKKLLKSKKMLTNVGDEGGFAPSINTNEQALELIVNAIEKSNLKPGKDIVICLDVAANELINEKGEYSIQSKNYTSVEDNISYYKKLTSSYPIKSIEDPFAEEDWESWKKITNEIGKTLVFCVSQKHALKITTILNELAEKYFPNQYQSDSAIQVTSDVTNPDPQQMTIDFKNNNLRGNSPLNELYKTSKARVCVTVGMMTTGYDCEDLLNICFLKPIVSHFLYNLSL